MDKAPKGFTPDTRKIIDKALERGWTGKMTQKNHFLMTWPGGGSPVILAGTPRGGKRSLQNSESALRRTETQHPLR